MVIGLFIGLVVGAVALARAYSEIDDEFVHDWADAHALTLTTANRPLVWWYLRNARVLRTWGVLAGIFLPPLALLAVGLGQEDSADTWWVFVFAGHLVGALYAELALRRPSPSSTRVASLEPRDVDQYLPARLRFAPAAVTALLVGVALVGWRAGIDPTDRNVAVGMVVCAPLVAAAVAAMQRWIVGRPQSFTAPDLVAADDAIRSQSIHILAGSGTAVELSLLGAVCWVVVAGDAEGPMATIIGFLGVATFPLALVACLYYGHRAWRVLRTPFLREPASTS